MFGRLGTLARALIQAAAARRRLKALKQLAAELPRDLPVVIDDDGMRLLVRRLPERAARGARA